ncbi:MAG: hypothetical protein K0S40_4438 [Actinomycetospora sp.]|nr:hypothetical protein [Actinomycetospora sp.]
MGWDAQVTAWLDEVLVGLRATGLVELVERTVAGVWERNVDRHDPVVAGDTATSLGITASENIRTLLLREDQATWAARGVAITSVQQALVLRAAGLRVLLMKADAAAPAWSTTRWETESDVRRLAAEENAARYEPPPEHQTGQFWWPGLGRPGRRDDGGPAGRALRRPAGQLAVATVWRHGPDDVPRPPEPVIAVPRARRPPDVRAVP